MSTTKDLGIAVSYSLSAHSLIFKVKFAALSEQARSAGSSSHSFIKQTI